MTEQRIAGWDGVAVEPYPTEQPTTQAGRLGHATKAGDRLCWFLQSVHESGEKLSPADAHMIHAEVLAIEREAAAAERKRELAPDYVPEEGRPRLPAEVEAYDRGFLDGIVHEKKRVRLTSERLARALHDLKIDAECGPEVGDDCVYAHQNNAAAILVALDAES